ncbi:MAG: putative porin [Bacteroidota bacterium]
MKARVLLIAYYCFIILFMLSVNSVFSITDSTLAELLVKKGIISEDELSVLQQEAVINSEIKSTDDIAEAIDSSLPSWVTKMRWSGDFRMRYSNEQGVNTNSKNNTQADMNKYEMRVRYGFVTQINDQIEFGFRMSTGEKKTTGQEHSTSPASATQTMGDAMNKKQINFDLAYLIYRPDAAVEITLGKMMNPFYSTELVFDSDLTFEGFAQKFIHEGDYGDFYLTFGQFILDYSSSNNNIPYLFGAQAGGVIYPGEDVSLNFAVSNYHYKNIAGYNLLNAYQIFPYNGMGNTITALGNYSTGYNLLNITSALKSRISDVPMRFEVDYVKNMDITSGVDSSKDTGYSLGMYCGEAKDIRTMEGFFMYKEVEADAVLGIFTDSTFGGGGANKKGYMTGLKYQLLENTQLGVTYMDTEDETPTSIEDTNAKIYQLDMLVKF